MHRASPRTVAALHWRIQVDRLWSPEVRRAYYAPKVHTRDAKTNLAAGMAKDEAARIHALLFPEGDD